MTQNRLKTTVVGGIEMIGQNGLLAFVLMIALASCQTTPPPVVIREPVIVEKPVYVKIKPALTAPCPVEAADPKAKRSNRGKELLRVARARKESLIGCSNARLKEISEIQGTPVETSP